MVNSTLGCIHTGLQGHWCGKANEISRKMRILPEYGGVDVSGSTQAIPCSIDHEDQIRGYTFKSIQ